MARGTVFLVWFDARFKAAVRALFKGGELQLRGVWKVAGEWCTPKSSREITLGLARCWLPRCPSSAEGSLEAPAWRSDACHHGGFESGKSKVQYILRSILWWIDSRKSCATEVIYEVRYDCDLQGLPGSLALTIPNVSTTCFTED